MGTTSENGFLFTIKVAGDTMNWSTPSGQSYTAKVDGTLAPFVGDPSMDTISVKRLSASIERAPGDLGQDAIQLWLSSCYPFCSVEFVANGRFVYLAFKLVDFT